MCLQLELQEEKERSGFDVQGALGRPVAAVVPPRSMISKEDLTEQIAAEDAESENVATLGMGSSVSDSHVEHESKTALMRILDFHSITSHAPHDALVEALMAWKHEQV